MKVTKATFKSFLRKNEGKLHVNHKRSFDGMIDGCAELHDGFTPVVKDDTFIEKSFGIKGLWLVGGGRDYFNAYNDGKYEGIEVFNCCGSSIIATKEATQ